MNKQVNINIISKALIIILGFATLILISELIFTVRNRPDVIKNVSANLYKYKKSYLEKYDYEAVNKHLLAPVEKRIAIEIFYEYLSETAKMDSNPEGCKPFCLPYNESQKLLNLFEKFDSERIVAGLSPSKRSDLYYWMATINVWKEDDKKTLEYLINSTALSDKNKEALEFKTDFQKLFDLESSENQKYFTEKLTSTADFRQYQKTYLAKASYILADNSVTEVQFEKALYFYEKAVELNPWNVTYNTSLSGIYMYLKKPEKAKNVLQKCIENIGADAKDCKDRLAGIQ